MNCSESPVENYTSIKILNELSSLIKNFICVSGTVLSLYCTFKVISFCGGVFNNFKEYKEVVYFTSLFKVLNVWLQTHMQFLCLSHVSSCDFDKMSMKIVAEVKFFLCLFILIS